MFTVSLVVWSSILRAKVNQNFNICYNVETFRYNVHSFNTIGKMITFKRSQSDILEIKYSYMIYGINMNENLLHGHNFKAHIKYMHFTNR